MSVELNEIKNHSVLEEERKFFLQHKKTFIQTFKYIYKEHYNCPNCILDIEHIANSFYEALYDNEKDCYKKQLCSLFRLKENNIDTGFLYSELTNELIDSFTNQNLDTAVIIPKIKSILQVCKKQQAALQEMLSAKECSSFESKTFDLCTNIAMQEGSIAYLKNLSNLGRNIKFFVHTEVGTCMSYARIEQVGNNSAVISVSDEQLSMLKLPNNSFVLKNKEFEKSFSVRAKILCAKESTVIIENLKELDSMPLLSRRYPRASIIHASVIHLANENEYISGNMIDISEGGIGVMSGAKSSFEKGQSIVAFISYEDAKGGFKFNFEATGHVVSIIGKENAFRYGIELDLEENEKSLIRALLGS
jgi:hypothetical protein